MSSRTNLWPQWLFIVVVLLIGVCAGKKAKEPAEEEPVDGENVPGHMLPLGAKTELLPVDVLTEFPDASEFFEKYVIPSRPVLFRGAAKQLPCYEHMRSEEFLR